MGLPDRAWLASHRGLVETTLRASRAASAFVVLSRTAAEAYRRLLGLDSVVVAPPVDLDAFVPGGPRAEAPTIVCAAAVDEARKRVGLLLEAFARVRRERPTAQLVLSRPESPAALRALGLPRPGVTLADLDDRDELAAAYRRAWTSVLPSTHEAFGLVLVEALACGTPVVGANRGAIPEVVDRPEIGRLFDESPDPAAGLGRALLEVFELAGDPATAAACRARAEDFSLTRCADAHVDLYARLLAGDRTHPSDA
jgi:glycosyltransferase involved in cell wall biosynthesis